MESGCEMRDQNPRSGWTRPALLAGVVVVSFMGIWLWSRPAAQPSVDAGRAVVEEFLKQIREGHPDQAWEGTTAEFKSAQGKESFVRKLQPLTFLTEPLNFVSTATIKIGDQSRSEYLYQASKGESLRIVVSRESGEWRVDRWEVPTGS